MVSWWDALNSKLNLADNLSLSKLTGNVALFFIMFTAVISALEKLAMTQISSVLENLLVLAGQILLGLVILAVALSFGLGGREAAGKHMEYLLSKFRKDG